MSAPRDLLIELGTEELPPKALKRLGEAFAQGLRDGLERAQLGFEALTHYETPRRLAVLIAGLETLQPDRPFERRGPALRAAFDAEGKPTRAAQGFAGSCGVAVEALERLENEQGAWLVYRGVEPGKAAGELVPALVGEALAALPIPKRMRWGSSTAEFVRPAHWLVLLFGDEVLDAEVLGLPAGRTTRGHRFHAPEPIELARPGDYAAVLEERGRVVASFAERRERVRRQVLAAAQSLGGEAVIGEDLLDEVTGMVEWPVALAGSFDKRFLEVPAEALVSSMRGHQKYFHVVDGAGRLLPHFIAVANIESRQPDAVRHGNERVIRPRLADAAFFWAQDRAQPLEAQLEPLKAVVFHKRLGSLYDKSTRVAALARRVAEQIGAEPAEAERAGLLSKCDLLTHMVGEFPELQGIMGRYYAMAAGEPEGVAQALDEQYMPRYAGDALPQDPVGQAVSIADKLDSLVGIFGVGEAPTGDKDPYALRRAALGVLRIAIEQRLAALDVPALLDAAVAAFGDALERAPVEAVYDFMLERLRGYYAEAGVTADVFDAVHALRPAQPADFDARVRAVTAFRALPEAEALAAANKRCANILRQAGERPEQLDAARLVEPAERALADAVERMAAEVEPRLAARDYEAALRALAGLRAPVDTFFDQVMVMAEDADLKRNRLALLARLQGLFLRVADIARLQS
ncbi:glycine--tRNA ligase subunit beta [Ectothiorhodospiraceae bacterium 2226]|nr:glycine--tRNA ligase subunit beta [Ectothiorhodospiraceae bacterium 2226]